MSPEQIRTALLEVLSKLAGLESARIKDSDRLREDLGLDSLQSMELLSRLSDRYELDLDIEDVMDVHTVGQVVTTLVDFMQAEKTA